MGTNGYKIKNHVNIQPQASAPSNPVLGDLYVDASGDFFRYDGATWTGIGGGGEGNAIAVAQTSHGFVAGDIGKALRSSGVAGEYTFAQADTGDNAEVVGILSAIADDNNFTYITGGKLTGLSGLTTGAVYFLSPSTAGAVTVTEPSVVGQISKPLYIATSPTTAVVVNMRGSTVGGTNLYSTIGLANNATTSFHTIQGEIGSGGLLTGSIKIDATTDYAIPFICMFSRPASGTYNVATQFGGDVPPAASGVNFGFASSGSSVRVVMPDVAGFSSASVTYAVQAAANGTTLPVSVSASSVLGSTSGVAPAAGVIGEVKTVAYNTSATASNTTSEVTSLLLNAGIWEVTVTAVLSRNSATYTDTHTEMILSSTTGNNQTGRVIAKNTVLSATAPTTFSTLTILLCNIRVVSDGTTLTVDGTTATTGQTVYLKMFPGIYSGAVPNLDLWMKAVRAG
jgi:hypothetical protein